MGDGGGRVGVLPKEESVNPREVRGVAHWLPFFRDMIPYARKKGKGDK